MILKKGIYSTRLFLCEASAKWFGEALTFCRSVQEDWDYHRSPFRYFRHVVTTVCSRALARTLIPCLAITFVAIFITLWNAVNPDYSVPLYSAGALNAISPVLGLLLVFRTNSAYGRFISAMQAWTDVIAFSRNFVRQVCTVLFSAWDCCGVDAHGLHVE